MRPTIQRMGDSFVYSCTFEESFAYEQFVPEHVLAFQLSGRTHIHQGKRETVLKKGEFLLARRNQFAKSHKVPGKDKEYKCLSVVLGASHLRQFAAANAIENHDRYRGTKNIVLKSNRALKRYFASILPYVDRSENMNDQLAETRIADLIKLLLRLRPELEHFLFDLHDPNKADLEAFMVANFKYNAPLETFAKLSGRSLTSFKREFAETFKTTPGKWLQNKRLSEAWYLIKRKKQKPQDFYVDLGFENLSHFYTAFKRKYGLTPSKIAEKL